MGSLLDVQAELKAPKNQRNNFGKYNYRSAEDILEAVKPLLKKYGCTLTITDKIEQVADRIYISATCKLVDGDGKEYFSNGYAREPEEKKGMDASQITGATSSYARKYALNGLFLIDDTKDADTEEYHKQTNKTAKKADAVGELKLTKGQLDLLKIKANSKEKLDWILSHYNVEKLEELTVRQASRILEIIKQKEEKGNEQGK